MSDETRELAEAKAARDEYFAHLHGHASLVGPCPHGRDPWTRCDTCGGTNAVQVALALRDGEKLARESLEMGRAEARRVVDEFVMERGKVLEALGGGVEDNIIGLARARMRDLKTAREGKTAMRERIQRAAKVLRFPTGSWEETVREALRALDGGES